MIRGLHHVALCAEDVDRLAQFYVDHYGFDVVWQCDVEGSERIVFLRAGNAFLELFQYHDPPSRLAPRRALTDSGYLHVCLDVEDIDAEHERLTRAGVVFESPPKDAVLLRFCFLADCEGNRVELMEIVDERTPFHLRRAGLEIAGAPPLADDDDRAAVLAAAAELRAIANGG